MRLLDLAYLLEKKYHLDLKIVIYGSGPLDKRIIQRKDMYGLNNVILRQFSSRPDFLLEMMNAMCVLIPSPFEAAPMVLLESMCLGKIPSCSIFLTLVSLQKMVNMAYCATIFKIWHLKLKNFMTEVPLRNLECRYAVSHAKITVLKKQRWLTTNFTRELPINYPFKIVRSPKAKP